jgi:type II secretory pathway component PulK
MNRRGNDEIRMTNDEWEADIRHSSFVIRHSPPLSPARRHGSVLILALIVIALLTLGAMTFFERMFVEHRATQSHLRQTQARNLADSGVEFIRAIATQDPATLLQSGGVFNNPTLFQGRLVADDPIAAYRGRFTILAPQLSELGYHSGIRYGLENESARLNLNTLLLLDNFEEDGARKMLMNLPGMTEAIADAILDWIDPDNDPRTLGAEQEYYSALDPPYMPRNGQLQSIEELLLVRDVTPALLFGADMNRNALVEANEEPYAQIPNVDNVMGVMNRGWAAYLTLDGAERNLRPDGSPKININSDDLQTLHNDARTVLGEEMANFIIAYRQGGAYEGEPGSRQVSAGSLELDFNQRGRVQLQTVLDLIGVFTQVVPQGQQGGEPQTCESPFRNDPSLMRDYLPKLFDNFSVNESPSIPGRLNINQAPKPLLRAIPGLPADAIDQIISSRRPEGAAERPDQAYETWILTDGIVELAEMKRLMPLITAGGDVYRAQVVGYFDAAGPASRLEVVVDATQSPPVVRRRRELVDQGPGYSLETLGVTLEDEP